MAFSKPIYSLTEHDLAELIGGVPESLTLDYKKSADLAKNQSKIEEISKDVSAFANSAGGLILYGLNEDNQFATGFDEGIDPNQITREWLENVILDNVRPRLQSLRVAQIDLVTQVPGRVAYVVSVEASDTAHQAKDFRYHRRCETQRRPMYDFEVRDTMNRRQHPRIRPEIRFSQGVQQDGYWLAELTIDLRNDSPIRATQIKFELYIPERAYVRALGYNVRQQLGGVPHSKNLHQLDCLRCTYRINDVVFPGDAFKLTSLNKNSVIIKYKGDDPDVFMGRRIEYLYYRVFADDAPLEATDFVLSRDHRL